MSGRYGREQPVKKPTGIVPSHCKACGAPSTGAWPLSKWTLSGFSPWCAKCSKKFGTNNGTHYNGRAKPGPKPKREDV